MSVVVREAGSTLSTDERPNECEFGYHADNVRGRSKP